MRVPANPNGSPIPPRIAKAAASKESAAFFLRVASDFSWQIGISPLHKALITFTEFQFRRTELSRALRYTDELIARIPLELSRQHLTEEVKKFWIAGPDTILKRIS